MKLEYLKSIERQTVHRMTDNTQLNLVEDPFETVVL